MDVDIVENVDDDEYSGADSSMDVSVTSQDEVEIATSVPSEVDITKCLC